MSGMSSIWDLRRSATDVKIAGVCGGIAARWNVDPVLVRVGCVLLALSGGVGLVLYVAAWLLIPVEGTSTSLIDDRLGDQARRWPREVRIVAVVLACLVSFAVLGSVSPFGFGPALILALIWYFGYYRTKIRRTPPPVSSIPPAGPQPGESLPHFPSYAGPPTAFTEAAEAWRQRIAATQQAGNSPEGPEARRYAVPDPAEDRGEPEGWLGTAADSGTPADRAAFLAHPDPVGIYQPEPAAAAAPVPVTIAETRPARRLRLVGLIALGLVLTGLGVADAQGAPLSPATYLAAALGVIGLVLIAATWLGRARGVLPVGILLALVTVSVTAAERIPGSDAWPTRPVAYASVEQLAAGDRLDVGQLVVDLRGLKLTGDARYAAAVDLGSVTVMAPPDTNLVVNYTVDAGAVRALGGERDSGTDLAGTWTSPSVDREAPTLTLDLTADVGQLEVVQ